ncbi:MAG TPA: efflux RND transporter periplasmic adaptor subunit [Blastocatellia bacterium]|nr:efflux RND transporter periplasmic adaptor subunit [Blastocatellia bacterium]
MSEQNDRLNEIRPRRSASDSRPERSRRITAWLLAAVVLALLAALIWWRWPKKAEEEKAEEVVVSVKVAKAERGPIAAHITALGAIFPKQQATVSAKISAPIAQMALLKNHAVRAGEPIVTLESRDLRAQRTEAAAALQEARSSLRSLSTGTIPQATAQAEKDLRDARASVENARATYERRQVLYDRGGISKKDLEAAQLALTTAEDQLRLAERTVTLRQTAINPNDRAQAEAKVRQAEERLANLDAQLSYATIRAPFAGIVTDQFQYRGEFAAAGAKLLNISDLSEVIVKAPFADTVAARLKAGDPAKVLPTDQPEEELAGRVSLVSRSADPTNRSVEIWVNLKNPGGRLRANSTAQVVVTTESVSDAVLVPASAVTLEASNAEDGTVMVVDDKLIAHETKVKVGIRTPDKVEITAGLTGGETVVVEGNYALPDKAKVEVNKGEEKEGDEKEGGKEAGKSGESGGGSPAKDSASPNSSAPAQGGASPGAGTGSNAGSAATPGASPAAQASPAPGPGSKATPGASPPGATPGPGSGTTPGKNPGAKQGSSTGSTSGVKP